MIALRRTFLKVRRTSYYEQKIMLVEYFGIKVL